MLDQARLDHPERFGAANPIPKILDLPADAWISKPFTPDEAGGSGSDQAAA